MKKENNNLIKLLAVSMGHFINDFYINLIPPVLFLFVSVLDLSMTEQGMITFAITSSGAFLQPVIGYFVDKKGEPWLLIASVAWIAFWMSITGLITNYYIFLIVVTLGATASALYHPLGSAVAVGIAKRTKGTSLSIFMTVGVFAFAISPLVSIPIIKNYGITKLAYLMIPGFLVALFMYMAGVHKTEFNIANIEDDKSSLKMDKKALKWIVALVYIATIRMVIQTALITFGVQILLIKSLDVKIAGIILSLNLFIRSTGTMAGGYLSDRIGNKKVFILSMLLGLVCLVLLVWTEGIIMIAGFIIIGFAMSGASTANVVLAQELIPQNVNVATGLIMGLATGIGGAGILLFGKLSDSYGLVFATGLLLIPLLLANILVFILPNKDTEGIDSIEVEI